MSTSVGTERERKGGQDSPAAENGVAEGGVVGAAKDLASTVAEGAKKIVSDAQRALAGGKESVVDTLDVVMRRFNDAGDTFKAISKGIGATYIRQGSRGMDPEAVTAAQEFLAAWAATDAGYDDAKLAGLRAEQKAGRFGPASSALLEEFQGSVRLDKETGELRVLTPEEKAAGGGLKQDGILGIRSLNAAAQWVALRSKEHAGDERLADMAAAMSGYVFKVGPDGDRSRFEQFGRATGWKWNADEGVGDGDDTRGAAYSLNDGEVSDPNFGKLSKAALAKVRQISELTGADPDWLLAVMHFESGGTFSPSVRNPVSGATGLIQFIPSTARSLGTTTDQLAGMSVERQLDFVRDYFVGVVRQHGRLTSLEKTYMAVLYPTAVAHDSENHVLFRKGSIEYAQNSGLDAGRDGSVSVKDAASKVRERLALVSGLG